MSQGDPDSLYCPRALTETTLATANSLPAGGESAALAGSQDPVHLQLELHGLLRDSKSEWCSDLLRVNDGLMNRGIFGTFVRWNWAAGIDGQVL